MKKIMLLMVIAASAMTMASCSVDEPEMTVVPQTQEEQAADEDNSSITVVVDPTETVVEETINI